MKKSWFILAGVVIFLFAGILSYVLFKNADIADKTFYMENGDSQITINADGTARYITSIASSASGESDWTREKNTLEVVYGDAKLKFSITDDILTFIEDGSKNYEELKLKNGDRFIAK